MKGAGLSCKGSTWRSKDLAIYRWGKLRHCGHGPYKVSLAPPDAPSVWRKTKQKRKHTLASGSFLEHRDPETPLYTPSWTFTQPWVSAVSGQLRLHNSPTRALSECTEVTWKEQTEAGWPQTPPQDWSMRVGPDVTWSSSSNLPSAHLLSCNQQDKANTVVQGPRPLALVTASPST